jgi:hypothetical protein
MLIQYWGCGKKLHAVTTSTSLQLIWFLPPIYCPTYSSYKLAISITGNNYGGDNSTTYARGKQFGHSTSHRKLEVNTTAVTSNVIILTVHGTSCGLFPHIKLLSKNDTLSKNHMTCIKGKGKAVPLQAWSGAGGSRNLRFPDFMTTAQDGGKVVSLTHRPPLPPGNTPGTHFR